jgi:hypothetical protein
MRSTPALLTLAVFGVANAGCSLIYTKGPQPEVQPPPPCTTWNTSPAADTVLAVLSVGAVVAGAVVYANGTTRHNCGFFCGFGEEVGGVGAMVIGGVGTLVFVPSAIVGFNRTAACRASLEAKPQQPASSPPPQSWLLLAPPEACPPGNGPRICSSTASWGPSALVLDEPPH